MIKLDDIKNKALLPPHGTDMLCENLVNTTFADLSEDNIRIFKDRLLDMTGCIFGGDIVAEDRFYYDMLKDQGGKAQAPLFADSKDIRLPLSSAVMHNCLHARANDYGNMAMVVFEDAIPCHYGETILPTNLTLADVFGATGEEFIANNIAAENLAGRILYTLPVRFPTDMQLGSTGAAALAARYYKFDAAQAKTALSYAATNATDPANSYYDYCQEFKLHNAESARMGIIAAEVTKGGWRGLEDPYFGNMGLISSKVDRGCLPDLYEKAFSDLGKTYFTEIRFKRGPGGMPTIATAELGRKAREMIIEVDGAFDAEKVKQVRILEPAGGWKNYYSNPFRLKNHTNALFSYAFACCCTLVYGERRVADIQTAAIQENPKLLELAENTIMDTYNNTAPRAILKVQVEMYDGRVFEAEQDFVAAMFYYPTQEDIEHKFWDQFNAFGKLPKSTGEKIIELAGKIETLKDMREYTELLSY